MAAGEDLPGVYGDNCQVSQSGTEVKSCVYGSGDSGTEVAVVGDSHAAHWVPAVRSIAEDRGWRLHTFTKASCAFTAADLEMPSNSNHSTYSECSRYNDALIEELTGELRPDLVFTSSSALVDKAGADSDDQDRAQIAAGMARMWESLEDAGSDIVAIRDTPTSFPRLPECVSRHAAEPGACALARDEAFEAADPQLIAARETDADVRVADLTAEFCLGGTCPPVIGNVLVYRDSHHMTATYSRLLAPFLEEAVAPAIDGR